METIKSVGRSGQISLGKKHAGRSVLIDQIDAGVWIIKLGKFIPESEQWLYQANIKNELNEAIAWAEKNPPCKKQFKSSGISIEKMNPTKPSLVRLDLNNPVFQSQLLNLPKKEQGIILGTLKKLMKMNWDQVYMDRGLKWEVILSRTGPDGGRLYSFRIGEGFRGVGYRHDDWLRILSIHPDHDSAYH